MTPPKRRTLRDVAVPEISPKPNASALFNLFAGAMLGYGVAKDKIKPTDALALAAILVQPDAATPLLKLLEERDAAAKRAAEEPQREQKTPTPVT